MLVYKPEDMNLGYDTAFNSGNVDAILALYEPEATLVIPPNTWVVGAEAIRAVYRDWLNADSTMRSETQYCIQQGDIALMRTKWRLTGTGSGGNAVDIQGDAIEVLRRQPAGHWCYLIDHSSGAI